MFIYLVARRVVALRRASHPQLPSLFTRTYVDRRRNILLITTDEQRTETLSCYLPCLTLYHVCVSVLCSSRSPVCITGRG